MNWTIVLAAVRAELHSGARGFRLFIACLAIATAAIAAAGSTADAFRAGLAAQSRTILGGDLAFEFTQRRPTAPMRAWLDARGKTSLVLEANAMATGPTTRRLVRVRAVDDAYPLAGAVTLVGGASLTQMLAPRGAIPSAVAEQAVYTALGAKVGDHIDLAGGTVVLTGVIASEPDAIGRGFAFAPRLLMRLSDSESLGLGRVGSLYDTQLRIALRPNLNAETVKTAFETIFAEVRGRVRTRENAAPGLRETIDRVEAFLGFVGLAALLAGGLGVQGAVLAFVESRRRQIATLKALGASGGEIRAIVGLTVAGLGVVGLVLGLAIGACAPFLVVAFEGAALPVPAIAALYSHALAVAALLGALATIAFAAGPIGSARTTAPAILFRGAGEAASSPWPEQALSWAALIALAGSAALFSNAPLFAGSLALGACGAFLALRGLGIAARSLARRAQPPTGAVIRLATAGLGGQGSLAPAAAPAIGLGIALLVFIAQIQSNLIAQVTQTAPRNFATAVFLEVPPGQGPAFDDLVARNVGRALSPDWYQRAPVLTARVTGLNGRDLIPERVPERARWIVNGDVSASFLGRRPSSFTIDAGQWWPADYAGPPLVSIDDEIAKALGAKVGDTLRFDVLGQDIDACIANLRRVNFDRMGPNFALVFAPGRFESANPRSVVLARLDARPQANLEAAVGKAFPTVAILRVRDVLQAAADLFRSLTGAIGAAAGVAITAGALAVAGALAAGARRRAYDAAILKTLGFTRAQIVAATALELALVGVVAAALGAGLGLAGAFPVVVNVIKAQWVTDWRLMAEVATGAALILGAFGALLGFAALTTPPSHVLRDGA